MSTFCIAPQSNAPACLATCHSHSASALAFVFATLWQWVVRPSCLRSPCHRIAIWQRLMLIARALVQQSPFLLLDEPTANLDFANQVRVLRHLDALSRSGLGIIMNSHSPGHAFACGTTAGFLDRKGQFNVGNVADMVTEERLSAVYGIPVRIVTVETDEGPMQTCVPEVKSR